jgi:sugar lactone lactonase YvrE
MENLNLVRPRTPPSELEVVFTFDRSAPPGNIAIAPGGRIFLSQHQLFGADARIVEVLPDGRVTPYPDASWAGPKRADGRGLHRVLGVVADRRGILWMLEESDALAAAGRLIAWNTVTHRLARVIYLAPPAISANAFLNDLAVDPVHHAVFIADPAAGPDGALIVVDLDIGHVRRVLEGSPFTVPEPIDMVIDGRVILVDGKPNRVGVNPITIDGAGEWLYFGAMSGRSLWRVRTRDLLDEDLPAAELARRVRRYGYKPISDGITIDTASNVYVTDITRNGIGVIRPDGTYEILFKDGLLSWPDGLAVGADDWIYVTVNQLHRSPPLNGGVDGSTGTFHVLRFKALAPAAIGR